MDQEKPPEKPHQLGYTIRYLCRETNTKGEPTGRTFTYYGCFLYTTLMEALDVLNKPPGNNTIKAEIHPVHISDEILYTGEYSFEQRTIEVPTVKITPKP